MNFLLNQMHAALCSFLLLVFGTEKSQNEPICEHSKQLPAEFTAGMCEVMKVGIYSSSCLPVCQFPIVQGHVCCGANAHTQK